jgi:hypothetical protein
MNSPTDGYKIPTREEHNRFIRNIWKLCVGSAIFIFLVTGSVVLTLFLKGYDSKKIVEVSTSIFQVLVLSYGMGFFVPAFLTSLVKMHLGIEMSRVSANILEKVDASIEKRLERFDKLLTSLEAAGTGEHPLIARLEKKADELTLDIKAEGRKIHAELERLSGAFTKPIPIRPPPGFKVPEGNGVPSGEKVGV